MAEPEERLYRVWHTVLEMLSDRNYHVSLTLLEADYDDFLAMHENAVNPDMPLRQRMTLHLARRDKQLRVLFLDRAVAGVEQDGKLRKHTIAGLVQRFGDHLGSGVQGLMVLSDQLTMTPPALKVLEAMCEETPGLLQWFYEEELVVNLVRRELAFGTRYTHQPATAALISEATARNLGRFYVVDPVPRYFNAQPGDIIGIERRSETGAVAKCYRRCVAVVHREDVKDFL
jgi:hypothetical protein